MWYQSARLITVQIDLLFGFSVRFVVAAIVYAAALLLVKIVETSSVKLPGRRQRSSHIVLRGRRRKARKETTNQKKLRRPSPRNIRPARARTDGTASRKDQDRLQGEDRFGSSFVTSWWC